MTHDGGTASAGPVTGEWRDSAVMYQVYPRIARADRALKLGLLS
jgi:hypothetical protein